MTDPYTSATPQGEEAYSRVAKPDRAEPDAGGEQPEPEGHERPDAEEGAEAGAPADAPDEAAVGASAAELAERLAEAERSRDEYLDHLRRERAEFENFRKRTAKERMDALDRGAEQLAANLLPVLDNFGFALDAAVRSEDDQLAKGVQMVHDQLLDVLRQAGLQEIKGADIPFDPIFHEAMTSEEADEPLDEPVVSEILRVGYRFKNRVLRPASVKVIR